MGALSIDSGLPMYETGREETPLCKAGEGEKVKSASDLIKPSMKSPDVIGAGRSGYSYIRDKDSLQRRV